jgi:hypothetical protein
VAPELEVVSSGAHLDHRGMMRAGVLQRCPNLRTFGGSGAGSLAHPRLRMGFEFEDGLRSTACPTTPACRGSLPGRGWEGAGGAPRMAIWWPFLIEQRREFSQYFVNNRRRS